MDTIFYNLKPHPDCSYHQYTFEELDLMIMDKPDLDKCVLLLFEAHSTGKYLSDLEYPDLYDQLEKIFVCYSHLVNWEVDDEDSDVW